LGRWKPPRPPSSPYITPEGAAALRAELRHLWRELRPEVVKALAAAAAEGDRSENAEYTYRKKQLGEIDRRVRYLRRRLETIRVVDGLPAERDRVRFGAWVKLRAADGREREYRIVGADETDAKACRISIDSPLARALLGRTTGDRVVAESPGGEILVTVLAVRYAEQ